MHHEIFNVFSRTTSPRQFVTAAWVALLVLRRAKIKNAFNFLDTQLRQQIVASRRCRQLLVDLLVRYGFNKISDYHSLYFYFVSIVFLIFNVESILTLPFTCCITFSNIITIFLIIYILKLVLILGFILKGGTGLLG